MNGHIGREDRGRLFEGLLDAVREEQAAYKNMLALSLEKKEALSGGDVLALEGILSRERRTLKQLEPAEARREKLACRLFEGQPSPTIEEMLVASPPEVAAQLRGMREEFLGVIQRLADVNDANRTLIESQREYTRMCLEILNGDGAPMYGSDGAPGEASTPSAVLLDHRV